MADDPIGQLAVGVAADHAEEKRRRRAKPSTTGEAVTGDGSGSPLEPVEGEGAAELRDAVASLGDAVDDAAERAIARFMAVAEDQHFESGTLVGDFRDALLDLFRAQQKPWGAILEADQRTIARGLEHVAKTIIRKLVVVIAEDDATAGAIHAKLESFTEKGGLKIALTAHSTLDTVVALHNASGQAVIVKRADPARYDGQRRDPATMPDQPGLEFEGGETPMPPTATGVDADLADSNFDLPPNDGEE